MSSLDNYEIIPAVPTNYLETELSKSLNCKDKKREE